MNRGTEHGSGPAWLELHGACNARDLGGLPATGGVTRRGVLFRSDALDALTLADVAMLVDGLGLAHVVDLRTDAEREERGRGLLGGAGIAYTELQVFDAQAMERRRAERLASVDSGVDPTDIMVQGYRFMLDVGTTTFVRAITQIVEPGGTPALVHCAAGKDRTGILVALLLELAGVERGAIVADYAATGERMAFLLERLQSSTAFGTAATELPAFAYEARAATMEELLRGMDEAWGGPVDYLVAHGVERQVVQRWREVFIQPI